MRQLLMSRPAVVLALAAALFVATACSDSPSEPKVGPAAEIEIISGDDQVGTAGAELPQPIIVLVLDAQGRPVPDQQIQFVILAGGGTTTTASARTNAQGGALLRWVLGQSVQAEQRAEVRAMSGNSTLASATILATAGPAPAAALTIAGGNNQMHWEGGVLGISPSVSVVDRFGNPLAGVPVTFTVASGGGTVTGGTVMTGALGTAAVGSWKLGTVGPNTLVASSGTLTPVTFTATAKSLTPARIVLSAGQDQTAPVGTFLPVRPAVIVQNAAGQALPGISVTFEPGPNSGNVSIPTVTTGTAGEAAVVGGWFLGYTAGAQTLVARVSPTITYTFNATATPGNAFVLVKRAGDAQGTTPGGTVPTPPSVFVRDAWGNAVAGVPVTFTVLTGGGSVTGATPTSDAAGIATVGSWTLGPMATTQTLRASAPGVSTDTDFTATALSGNPVELRLAPGNPTSGLLRSEITISVIAVNEVGTGMPDVPVTFAPLTSQFGQGTVIGPNRVTNAQGVASVQYLMPDNIYAFGGVIATSPGVPPLTVHVDPVYGPPSEIRVTLGSATVVAGADIGQPVFSVWDAYGNAIPSVRVRFSVTTGGGTVDGFAEVIYGTPLPPSETMIGPMWRSGPVPSVNTVVVSLPDHPMVPSVQLSRTTVPPQ